MFNDILLTNKGINFINKQVNKKFKEAIRQKLESFYDSSYDNQEFKAEIIEWNMKIFKRPILQERKKEEEEVLDECYEKIPVAAMNNNYREEWITAIAEESLLTRSRRSFLINIWDVLHKMDYSITMRERECHNRALFDMLTTYYGQNMLEQYPGLTTMLKTEICHQYSNGIEFWEECWYFVFQDDQAMNVPSSDNGPSNDSAPSSDSDDIAH